MVLQVLGRQPVAGSGNFRINVRLILQVGIPAGALDIQQFLLLILGRLDLLLIRRVHLQQLLLIRIRFIHDRRRAGHIRQRVGPILGGFQIVDGINLFHHGDNQWIFTRRHRLVQVKLLLQLSGVLRGPLCLKQTDLRLLLSEELLLCCAAFLRLRQVDHHLHIVRRHGELRRCHRRVLHLQRLLQRRTMSIVNLGLRPLRLRHA